MDELSRFFPEGTPPAVAWIGQLLWILQLALIVHVYQTGRPYWWIWLLLVAPVVGGLAYVLIEVRPPLGGSRGVWYALKPRRWRIADLRNELDESETVENRLALAEELFEAGDVHEAHNVAVECLRGVFKDDPRTLFDVARYQARLGRFDEALGLLERIDTTGNKMLALEIAVQKGDCLTGLKRFEEAEAAYKTVIGRYVGEAPRAGLAEVYGQMGRVSEAVALWREILTRFRKAGPAWRRSERRWYRLAKTRLDVQKS